MLTAGCRQYNHIQIKMLNVDIICNMYLHSYYLLQEKIHLHQKIFIT